MFPLCLFWLRMSVSTASSSLQPGSSFTDPQHVGLLSHHSILGVRPFLLSPSSLPKSCCVSFVCKLIRAARLLGSSLRNSHDLLKSKWEVGCDVPKVEKSTKKSTQKSNQIEKYWRKHSKMYSKSVQVKNY